MLSVLFTERPAVVVEERSASPLTIPHMPPAAGHYVLHPPLPSVTNSPKGFIPPVTSVPLLLNPDIMHGTPIPIISPQVSHVQVCSPQVNHATRLLIVMYRCVLTTGKSCHPHPHHLTTGKSCTGVCSPQVNHATPIPIISPQVSHVQVCAHHR